VGKDIGGIEESATKPASALSVERNTRPTNTRTPNHALQNAEVVYLLRITKLEKPAKVYNLSVFDTPEYFANGILVHNCIAMGVCWLIYGEGIEGIAIDTGEERDQTPAYGSFLWRERREQTRIDSDSPEFGFRDVVWY
jgi:hypothetical protein